MQNLKCLSHQQKSIIGFCVNKTCLEQRSCCLKCLQEFHLEHPKEIVELDDYNTWIKPTTDLLPKIQEYIKDIEYVVQIIKLSFQNFSKCFALDKLTTKNLSHIVSAALKIDQQQIKFLEVISSLQDFTKSIQNIDLTNFINLDINKQGEQLLKSKKWDESLQYLTNLYGQQNNDFEKLLPTSLQSTRIIFNSFGLYDQYVFSKELTSPHITLSKNETIAMKVSQQYPCNYAIATPSISIKQLIKLKFKIVDWREWITIGICTKKTATKTNHSWDDISKLGHGFYMIAYNGYYVYCYSDHDEQFNNQTSKSLRMAKDDIILMTVDNSAGQLSWVNENTNQSFTMRFIVTPDMHICVGLQQVGDSVSLINL